MPFSTPPTANELAAMRTNALASLNAAYDSIVADPPTLTLCEALEAALEAHNEGRQEIQDAMVAAGCGQSPSDPIEP